MSKRIVVGLDGSPLAERSLPYATALARASQIPIVLVHAVAWHGDAAAIATHEGEAKQYLARIAARLASDGAIVEPTVAVGDPVEILMSQIGLTPDDLVIVTTHGRSGLGRWVYGSVAEAVLARSPAPVLVVRAWAPHRALDGQTGVRLLVPLDGSHLAEAALPVAAEIARALTGEVLLIDIIDLITPVSAAVAAGWGYLPQDLPLEDEHLAAGYLDGIVGQLRTQGVRADRAVAIDTPAVGIVDAADQGAADLIVMATHGRTGLVRGILGSVALEVLHRARQPVLFVRPSEEPNTPT